MKSITMALLGGLLSMPVLAEEQFNIELLGQLDNSWRIQRVHVEPETDTTVVSGRLTAAGRIGLPRGHVDIAAYSPGGELLREATAGHTPGIFTRRMQRHGGVRFKATLDARIPQGSIVKLALHRDAYMAPETPEHRGNIAH